MKICLINSRTMKNKLPLKLKTSCLKKNYNRKTTLKTKAI